MIRAFLTVCVIFGTGTSFAEEPAKKLIEWGWDEPDTNFIRTNERLPREYVTAMENARNSPTTKRSDGETKSPNFSNVKCAGTYPHHLQGICTNDRDAIYWCFTTTLVKTDTTGKVQKQIPVGKHHGDLCHVDGKIYVAVNFGKFNDPNGNADSWVYVYDADDLSLLAKHETQEVFHGAGGIGVCDGHFFVVGGLPEGIEENYVYEYDADFTFVKKHVVKSGHTHLGIQTGAFANGHWWFGCYGDPKILLVTDADFKLKGRYEFDCSLGIVGLLDGQFLSASGRCEKDKGCWGSARLAAQDEFSRGNQ